MNMQGVIDEIRETAQVTGWTATNVRQNDLAAGMDLVNLPILIDVRMLAGFDEVHVIGNVIVTGQKNQFVYGIERITAIMVAWP